MKTRAVLAIILIGLMSGMVLFAATGGARGYTYLGPLCAQNSEGPGFDLLTGEPYGRSFDLGGGTGPCAYEAKHITGDVPAELVGRRAIPFPVGFTLGAGAALLIVLGISAAGGGLARRTSPGRSPIS